MKTTKPHVLLWLLTAAFTLDHVDRLILSLTLDMIGKEFILSDFQLGTLSGLAFAVVFVIMGFPLARLAKPGLRKKMVIGTLTVWSFMTLLSGTANSYLHLFLARMGVGLGEAGYLPSAHSMLADAYPPERRAGAFSILTSGVNIGVFFAFIIGGVVAANYGWRAAFFVAGAPGFILAVIIYFSLHEPKTPAFEIQENPTPAVRAYITLAREMFSNPAIRHILFGMLLISMVNYGSVAWLATWLLRTQGLGLAQVGIYIALTAGIGGAIGVWVGGYLANRAEMRFAGGGLVVVAISVLLTEPFSITAYLIEPSMIALIILILPAMAANIFTGPGFAAIYTRLAPSDRPMATAVITFMMNLVGLGLGPMIVGLTSDFLADTGTTRAPIAIALASIQCVTFWGAAHYLFAARAIRKQEGATP
jgi:predicted MFS family arabinose efflux permease